MPRLVSLLFHDVYRFDPGESGFRSRVADRYKLTAAAFEAQLRGLSAAARGAPILTPELLSPSGPPPDRFLLTFDDGGVSCHDEVADRLDEFGWHGAIFVTTDCIGQRGFLERSHLRELDARGHEIGSHSASHPTRFASCPASRMRDEWTRSRKTLEDLLGRPVLMASLPGGYYSRPAAETAAEAGYRVLFNSEPSTRLQQVNGCVVAGRFTIRHGSPARTAAALVSTPSARATAWARWRAKAAIKRLLGPAYPALSESLLACTTASPNRP
jgi:peptidoglycan/xylan/chitin deacetylase (PgdA/CDA1 family)